MEIKIINYVLREKRNGQKVGTAVDQVQLTAPVSRDKDN